MMEKNRALIIVCLVLYVILIFWLIINPLEKNINLKLVMLVYSIGGLTSLYSYKLFLKVYIVMFFVVMSYYFLI